jgi:hypothetical protein
MKLHQVLEQGLPIRRKGNHSWVLLDQWCPGDWEALHFSLEDVLADDWEVQEPKVTITRSQFWDAVAEVLKEELFCPIYPPRPDIQVLARKLGLEK